MRRYSSFNCRLCSTHPAQKNEKAVTEILSTTCRTTRKTPLRKEGELQPHLKSPSDTDVAHRYSLHDGATFAEQVKNVTFDLAGDSGAQERKRRELHWDKSKKKFVKGTGEGADNVKMVKTESGMKLPATYRSGRFDEWRAKSRFSLPRVGEEEVAVPKSAAQGGRKWKHNQTAAAKPLDKLRTDYERKTREISMRKKHGEPEPERPSTTPKGKRPGQNKRLGARFNGKTVGRVKNELKTVDQIRKARLVAERKKEKNARPTRGGGKGGRKGRR